MSPIRAASDLAAGCKVKLGGTTMDPAIADRIVDLRVETTSGLPDVCMIRFTENAPDSTGTLKVIDDSRLALGVPLAVDLAKATGGQPAPVFEGEITTIEADLGASPTGDPVLELTVTAHDRSHRMHRRTTTRTLRQMTVQDIARKMAGEYSLRVGTLAPLGGGAPDERHQVGESDWEYLSRLVRENGGELDVAAGELHVIDPTSSQPAVAELVYGESLQRFRPRVSSVGQVAAVDVRGWDVKKKMVIASTGTVKAATSVQDNSVNGAVDGSKVLVATAHVSTKDEADTRSKAAASNIGHERVQGTAIAAGDPRLLAGAYVDVAGVGTRFGGTYRIVSATHRYGTHGYTTHLTFGAGGRPLAETFHAGRSRSFADHLVIGIVTDNSDADKLGRVKVRYPLLNDEVESGWARIAWGAAGAERGTVSLPHVNDEVAIGFEHGDVRRPVVLGALFNGVDKPGTDLVKADNSVAARFPRTLDVATAASTLLTAKKDLKVKTEEGAVELAAGAGMKLSASGAGAPASITLETTGQIKAKGDQGVEITATGPIKITAQGPATVESTAALQLKGTAITVQATGVLKLAGASVMLG